LNSRIQMIVNAKVSKLILRTKDTKNQKPFLIKSIIDKITGLEGIKPQDHIYQSKD